MLGRPEIQDTTLASLVALRGHDPPADTLSFEMNTEAVLHVVVNGEDQSPTRLQDQTLRQAETASETRLLVTQFEIFLPASHLVARRH
jgi:hypothetical protein